MAVTVLNAHPTLLHAVLLTVPAVNIVGSPCTLIVNDATGNASAYDADGTATAAAIAGRMNHAKFGSSPKSVIEMCIRDRMKYQRLKNLVILVTAVAYFAATFLGQQMKLRILCEKLMIISQRFFGIPPFRFYALADGIRRILSQGTCLLYTSRCV